MKLLVNDKEIAAFLFGLMDHLESCKLLEMQESNTATAITEFIDRKARMNYNPGKDNLKFKDKLVKAISKDLQDFVNRINSHLENRKSTYYKLLHTKLDFFLNALGEEKVLKLYKESNQQNFVKSTGLLIDSTATVVRRNTFSPTNEDCVFRNTVGNENLIISKIDQRLPFWFIDSGYTNFLEPNKKWHRLVHNHIHPHTLIDVPVDRLGIFKEFPRQWRGDGDKILVIEPGPFAAAIFHVDVKKWRYEIEQELRKYTDKKIVFREKFPKKSRPNLYKHLCNEDYHCVVHINSNAATEAIWAGIPVITLDKHVSLPVSSRQLSEINNLAKPNLANWLCTLSYSQFTYEELIDGTAVNILKKYHD
jgi:hypothetical protein